MTFPELEERYLGSLNGRASHRFYCRLARQYFYDWREHPAKPLIRQWHRDHAATPAHANKGLGFLKALYNWAINEDLWHTDNPVSGIRRHASYDRERTLTTRELALFMNAAEFMFWKFRVLSYVLLTTGSRLTEACQMQWTHIDLPAGSWTKPTTKNGRPHRIPVPRQTCEAIDKLPRSGRFIFMGLYDHPLSRGAAEKMWGIVRRPAFRDGDPWPALRMPDVRLHDFRRTVASRLLDQGESVLLIKSVLNHHKGDVTGIYARSSFDQQARALQTQADGLWSLIQQVPHDTQSPLPFLVPVPLGLCPPVSTRV